MANKIQFKRPCNDCPYRRNSTPGWTGSGTPEHYVSAARADYYGDAEPPNVVSGPNIAEPCHKAIDYTDPNWQRTQLPDAPVCVGGLIFNKNNGKRPRHRARGELVTQVEPNPDVFRTDEEFIRHHRGPNSIESWEPRQ